MSRYRPPNLVGTTVENRFHILSLLGEGGMAIVYKARNQLTGQFVAIKVLKRHEQFSFADIERMKREARALRSLFHPNIVRAHSFGFLDSGEPYLVLDFLSGRGLDEYIVAGGLHLRWILEVLIQICRGLSCAHDGGLIHRDLKPSNVMIIDSPEAGALLVKLLDFGTAKSVVSQPDELVLTQKGIIFGSPYYISPEQISGHPFDKRTDLYSLGCLMYELMSGKLPHEGKTDLDTLTSHLHNTPLSFSEIAFDRHIPYDVEEIVFKCMEKNPDRRFQTAGEVEQSLSESLANFIGQARRGKPFIQGSV
jgi:eukaryotic-like serine/threonine-protein kinase